MAEKSASEAPVLDLFGQPWLEPRDPRGRKSHRWSMQVAETVAVLKATGEGDQEIATRVGLSLPTLKKYYFRELEQGAALVRQALNKTMLAQALKGNVSAAKFIRDEIERGELIDVAYRAPTGREAPAPRAPKRGLKEQRQAAAEELGEGLYAPGEPPEALTTH